MLKYLWLAALVIVLDQLTKYFATVDLKLYQSVPFIPFMDLTLMHNTGAAFSFLSQAGGWQRWFFSVLAIAVSVYIVIWLKKLKPTENLQAIALALVLGGALGNVIDRLLLGYVVDFLDFYYVADQCIPFFSPSTRDAIATCHWPAFNIADMAIFSGVALLIIDSVRASIHSKNTENTSSSVS